MSAFSWVRSNKVAVILMVILLFVLGHQWKTDRVSMGVSSFISPYAEKSMPMDTGIAARQGSIGMMPPVRDDYTPAPQVANRLVMSDANLSLLVANVRETVDRILAQTQQSGGYMVTSSLASAENTPSGTVVVRIPARALETTLAYFRGLALTVVSENLTGQDVTDQYVDNESRMATLLATKRKFEDIFNRATEVSDIVNIQQQLISLQSQIDQVKGQQQYLEKNAQMAKVTIYLSTDELALPYAPKETWRAGVIFKYAVRALVGNIQSIGTFFIWVVVYSVFWIPALIVLWYMKKRMR